jgi:hypothetical protein
VAWAPTGRCPRPMAVIWWSCRARRTLTVELQGSLDLGDGEYRLTRVPQASVNAEQLSATAGLVGSWRFDGEAELTLQDDTGEPLELQGRLSRP